MNNYLTASLLNKLDDEDKKNEIWSAYQKDIADDHYYFARSCIRQNFSGSGKFIY